MVFGSTGKAASALDLRAPKVVPLTCLSATPLPSASEKHLSYSFVILDPGFPNQRCDPINDGFWSMPGQVVNKEEPWPLERPKS